MMAPMRTDLPDARRMPSSEELREILEKYCFGPLSPEQVATVEERLRDVLRSKAEHAMESDQFWGSAHLWAGRLFMEEEKVPRAPRVADMACVVAARLLGTAALKPYCPEALVGAWEDAANPAMRWELGGDGTFRTQEPEYAAATRWYVVRYGGVVGDAVRLVEAWGEPEKLGVVRVSSTELVLERTPRLDRTYTLRRAR